MSILWAVSSPTKLLLPLRGAPAAACAKRRMLAAVACHLRSCGAAAALSRQQRALASPAAASSNFLPKAVPAEVLFRQDSGPRLELGHGAVSSLDRGSVCALFVRQQAQADGAGEQVEDKELQLLPHRFSDDQAQFLLESVKNRGFAGKVGEANCLSSLMDSSGPVQVIMVGLGPSGKEPDWRLVGCSIARELKPLKSIQGKSISLDCDIAEAEGGGETAVSIQPFLEGLRLGFHVDRRFKGTQTPQRERSVEDAGPKDLKLHFKQEQVCESSRVAALQKADAFATGAIFARELVNAPANIVDPVNLAAAAGDLANRFGLEAKIMEEDECEKLGMGSFLAVGRCSNVPSKFIHLTYRPSPESGPVTRKVGIVGKGVTFDAGGYNLKAGAGSMIEDMKFDMGGAAATLGAAAVVAQLKPPGVEVHFVIAACENMISGNQGALHPGDIITAMDGTTIEVNNTDAEGRLTLADALLYCQQQGATEIVDVATLTGACMVALGKDVAGMWSNSDELAQSLEHAAKCTGEKVWRMPLEESYWEGMKSDLADMKNTGGRWGGAITAALFLSKFIRKGVSWAHVDIAGTAWTEKARGLNTSPGGTGAMARALAHFAIGDAGANSGAGRA